MKSELTTCGEVTVSSLLAVATNSLSLRRSRSTQTH